MPVLSIFYGIIVRMYREQGGKHCLTFTRNILAKKSWWDLTVLLSRAASQRIN